MAEEYIYACGKCPRTFKLRDFYEKHEKVHALKKQHMCSVCGFVYGAAKGLEGHMESAHNRERSNPEPALTVTEPAKPMQELPFGLGFHFLQTTGVLAAADQARLAQESASLLQKTHQAMLAQMNKSRANLSGLSLVPLTISATSPSTPISVSPNSRIHDKSKIPSPAGTGTYKIYDDVPKIHDAGDALQNDSGFFRCTICTREFSGLNSLKKHVPIHTRRVQHKCDTCGYVFGKKEYLLDHMRKHTGEISPVCEVCGQTFNKSLKLKEHQKLHKNPGSDKTSSDAVPYRCHICKKCFSSADPLGDHLRRQHSETVYKCDMCDATFGDVRGKNHHMYNEHQLDAFHQKCVWCPVCNQGFTRHYNLKVHMYKSHGKEYLENNFSQEELDSLMRPPPGSNTSKPSPSPRKVDKEELIIQGAPTGILPISPPLTPKQSPGQRLTGDESSISPNSASNTNKVSIKARPGPASRTKHSQYFKEEAQNLMLNCEFCEDKFLRKSDLYTHMWEHEVTYLDCKMCSDKFLEISDLQHHLALVHGQIESLKDRHPNPRKPGPASRTNAPKENRAHQIINSNIPSHLAAQYPDSSGYPCQQCGKVLMHKQSYVSHMRVIHGDYYGGNKWKGSSVVQLVLGDQENKKRLQEDQKSQISTALHNITNHPEENLASLIYNDVKLGVACEFCNKVFNDQTSIEEHILTVHPYLKKRIQAFKDSHGLKDSDEPDKKRLRLDYEGIYKEPNEKILSSNSILSFPLSHAQLSPYGNDEPLNLACKPVSVSVHEENQSNHLTFSNDHGNNLLQVVQTCSPSSFYPLNLHKSQSTKPELSSPGKESVPSVSNMGHAYTLGLGTQDKLHEFLVKQSNATEDDRGRKKFLCPVCKCQLSWKTNLSVHLRTHSGERPFQCILCSNRFRQKAHLYKHFRCSHGHKVAPYLCTFCPKTFTRSPNDLYNHITEVHTLKSGELANNNNFNGLDKGETQTQPLSLVLPSVLTPPSETSERSFSNEEEIDDERDEYDKKDEENDDYEKHMVQDREDDVRFEPITEEFLFEGRMIRPSYCVLPFVTDEEVETQTRRNITDYYDPSEEFSEEEEGQMVIDENPVEKERSYTSNFNNNEIKVSAIGQGFADSINICNKEEDTPTHSVRLESTQPFFYPSFSNFSLPFSLSTLLQKKKEIAAILVPRTPQLNQSKLTLEHLSKAAMSIKSQISPTKSDSANTTAVSEYEHQIQNDLWPIDCIKCTALLPNLENFNIHMNDHWSDDKCCPVCGLLINSKRFNFKQHLKIHTGEKPFVCQICSRAFRQKAHMVKHVTTHRSEPRSVGHDLTFQPGVIVQ